MSWLKDIFRESVILLPKLTPSFMIRIFIEVFIIAFVIYKFLNWVKSSQAWVLLRGIGIISLMGAIAVLLQLDSIIWIFGKLSYVAITMLMIVFQPELRKGLEKIGNTKMFEGIIPQNKQNEFENMRKVYEEIADASFKMGEKCTGALMVIKRKQDLEEIKSTGIVVDGYVTSALLINIFEKNTPLHDGAVVIEGDRVACATCYLPLSDNMNISKSLGTRHRAALGISEVTDTVTVVVSEETGKVKVVHNGKLYAMNTEEELVKYLILGDTPEVKEVKGRVFLRRSFINGKAEKK